VDFTTPQKIRIGAKILLDHNNT